MTYDIWQRERESAEIVAHGLRIIRRDNPPVALVWNPKAFKPAGHYRFRSVEARDEYISKYIAAYADGQQRKAVRKAESRNLVEQHHAEVKIGHIFVYSWGYDQTNINFYQVVAKHGQNVTVREIAQAIVPGSASFDAERVKPRIGHFLAGAKPITKRPYFTEDGRAYLSFSFGSCQLWRGESSYQSHYA